jgi:hypothetical protein
MKKGKKARSLILIALFLGLFLIPSGVWAITISNQLAGDSLLQVDIQVLVADDTFDPSVLGASAPTLSAGEYIYLYQARNDSPVVTLSQFSFGGLFPIIDAGVILDQDKPSTSPTSIQPDPSDSNNYPTALGSGVVFNYATEIAPGEYTDWMYLVSMTAPELAQDLYAGALLQIADHTVTAFGYLPAPGMFSSSDSPSTVPTVPEPASLLLLGIGIIGAGIFRKKMSCKP